MKINISSNTLSDTSLIYLDNGKYLSLNDSVFENNTCQNCNGACMNVIGSILALQNNNFTNNYG